VAGRPSKRTPEREKRLLDAIRAGSTRKAACAYAGISDETLANWCRRSLDFLDALARAEAEYEVKCNAIISQAAQTDARHAEWWLERRRPEEYGRKDRIDLNVIRSEAERLARELGLDPAEVMAEAELILKDR
jgi:transposase